jgi:hypothetical protein
MAGRVRRTVTTEGSKCWIQSTSAAKASLSALTGHLFIKYAAIPGRTFASSTVSPESDRLSNFAHPAINTKASVDKKFPFRPSGKHCPFN